MNLSSDQLKAFLLRSLKSECATESSLTIVPLFLFISNPDICLKFCLMASAKLSSSAAII